MMVISCFAGWRKLFLALPTTSVIACEEVRAARDEASHSHASSVSAVAPLRHVVEFQGACDASGAVPIDDRRFAVADDEDNVLRVYDGERGGPPQATVDLAPHLDLRKTKNPESDIEAATRYRDAAFFLTSHARKRSGKVDPDRSLFFAVSLPLPNAATSLIGRPYRGLVSVLRDDARYAGLGIGRAAELSPSQPGGLNIEGMTAAPDGSFLIGFRSPVPEGRALLFWLHNPVEVLHGAAPRVSDPLLLDLGGLGVRAITRRGEDYVLVGGPPGDGGHFFLFRFGGEGAAQRIQRVDLSGFGVEGFFSPPGRSDFMLLSDDGTRLIQNEPCKKLARAEQKSFRGIWLTLAE